MLPGAELFVAGAGIEEAPPAALFELGLFEPVLLEVELLEFEPFEDFELGVELLPFFFL